MQNKNSETTYLTECTINGAMLNVGSLPPYSQRLGWDENVSDYQTRQLFKVLLNGSTMNIYYILFTFSI